MLKKEKIFSICAYFEKPASEYLDPERTSVKLSINLVEFKNEVLNFISRNWEQLFKSVDGVTDSHAFTFRELIETNNEVQDLIAGGWKFDGYSCASRFRYHTGSGFLFVDVLDLLFVAKLVNHAFIEVPIPYGLKLENDLIITGNDVRYEVEKGPWPFVLEDPEGYLAYGKLTYLLTDSPTNPLTALSKSGSVAEIAHAEKIKCILEEVLSAMPTSF